MLSGTFGADYFPLFGSIPNGFGKGSPKGVPGEFVTSAGGVQELNARPHILYYILYHIPLL